MLTAWKVHNDKQFSRVETLKEKKKTTTTSKKKNKTKQNKNKKTAARPFMKSYCTK